MAKRKRTTKRTAKKEQSTVVSPLMIGAVVIGALLIVGGLIFLGTQNTGNGSASATVDVTDFPTLGNEEAPVTVIEYSDYG